jgi:hypothetical protein
MKYSLSLLLLFSLVCVNLSAKNKEPIEDEQLWLAAKAEYEINNSIEIELAQKFRFFNNIHEFSQYISDIGGYYKFSDLFKIGVFYRFRLYPNANAHRHEIYSNFINKLKFGAFSLQNRLRLHIKFRDDKESINYLRYRLSVKYNLFQFMRPFAYAEIFYRFIYNKGDRISQGRYAGGLEFPIADSHKIDLFYMYETAYNSKREIYTNVIGLYYTFEF